MAEKVRRPSQYSDMMEELKELGLFEKYTNILVFAACLGFRRKHSVEFSKSAEPVRLDLFNDAYDQAIINAIAFLERKNDPLMLSSEKLPEKLKIFEEYACGGLEILEREVWAPKLNWEESLIDMILNEYQEENVLTNLTEEISSVSNF